MASKLPSGHPDPAYPNIAYRRGASGILAPVIAGTGTHVQILVISHYHWKEPVQEIAEDEDYGIPIEKVEEALRFYQAHKDEIDNLIRIDREIEQHYDQKS